MNETLHQLLNQLRLNGMAKFLDQELQRAEKEGSPVSEIIYRLLLQEQAFRQERSLLYRLQHAKVPWDWTLKTFPFDKQPGVNKAQIQQLAGLSFLERTENIVFIGNPGTGKSGLAIGLLYQALISGYRGRFYNAQDLLDELYASLADRSTPRLMKRLCTYQPLVIDELGYLTLKSEQVNSFFKLMGERYGRKSTIITTNLLCGAPHNKFVETNVVSPGLEKSMTLLITDSILPEADWSCLMICFTFSGLSSLSTTFSRAFR